MNILFIFTALFMAVVAWVMFRLKQARRHLEAL